MYNKFLICSYNEKKNINLFFQEDLKKIYLCCKIKEFNELFLLGKNVNIIFFNKFLCFFNINIKFYSFSNILYKQCKLFIKSLYYGVFIEFKIIGLGFKFQKILSYGMKNIKIDLGFGHTIIYNLPLNVQLFRVKKKFVFFSNNFDILKTISKQISFFKPLNCYKIRGFKQTKKVLKFKVGKNKKRR